MGRRGVLNEKELGGGSVSKPCIKEITNILNCELYDSPIVVELEIRNIGNSLRVSEEDHVLPLSAAGGASGSYLIELC